MREGCVREGRGARVRGACEGVERVCDGRGMWGRERACEGRGVGGRGARVRGGAYEGRGTRM